MSFDPNSPGIRGNNIYGLPYSVDDAQIVIIPVPWEVTVSFSAGTVRGPEAIFDASFQVDLYDPVIKESWKIGIAMEHISDEWQNRCRGLRSDVSKYLESLTNSEDIVDSQKALELQKRVNFESSKLNDWLREKARSYLRTKKVPVVIGGDHSTPFGLIQALSEKYDSFGILQIDAHADLREAYEGFVFSHASIMYNAIKLPQVTKLVQVGVRDCCDAEVSLINKSKGRIEVLWDRDIKLRTFNGETWSTICRCIIERLPQRVYISFDIDGLDPKLCPHTGTPVPGGLELEEVLYLVEQIVSTGREIISFDITEVGWDEHRNWDGNVGARALYRIALLCAKSLGFTPGPRL